MNTKACSRGKVALYYPLDWYTPVHPHAAEAERSTAALLRRHGVLAGPQALARFRAIDVARHGGWPFFFAGPEALRTITGFLTIWLFHDDGIEGTDNHEIEIAVAAVRGDDDLDPTALGPCLRAWHENAGAYRSVMSAAFCAELGARFREWQESVGEETAQIVRLRATGEHPSVADYLACRERSIGVYPVLRLLEYACGRALPAELRGDAAFQEVERRAIEVVILQNDLVSAAKEKSNAQVNLVLSVRHEHGYGLAEARAEVVHRHDAAVAKLQAALAELTRTAPDDLYLRRWSRAVRTMCHGFARWHTCAPRYVEGRVVVEYV